jgi:hypothetical protein
MEYSSKYRVSISTLRRRIKADDINFVFRDGKYLILDEEVSTHQRVHRPSQDTSVNSMMGAHEESSYDYEEDVPEHQPMQKNQASNQSSQSQAQDNVMSVANQLLTELKKAYSQILSEKEEQILHLKEEMADLKTLVRVLESENERLSLNVNL